MPVIGAELITLDSLKTSELFYKNLGFMSYSQAGLNKYLTPLAFNTGNIDKVLKINSKDKTEDEAKTLEMLENTFLIFDLVNQMYDISKATSEV